jgi:DNA modification methylase
MRETRCDIKRGDCLEVLRDYADNSFDLIFTSPPYADSRAKTYGGIRHDLCVDWFLPRSDQLLRVLKRVGTIVLNTSETVVN